MGCCFTNYKISFEVYFRICLNSFGFYTNSIDQLLDIVINGNSKNEEVNNKLKNLFNNNKIENIDRIDNLNDKTYNGISKSMYSSLLDIILEDNTLNSKRKDDFPDEKIFLKNLLESLYKGNKNKLLLNLIAFNHESESKDKKELNYLIYNIITKEIKDIKIENLKTFIIDYLNYTIIHPYEAVFYKTDNVDKKIEIKEIIEDIANSKHIEQYAELILSNNRNLSDRKESFIDSESFNEIFSNPIWSWNVLKLREKYFMTNNI